MIRTIQKVQERTKTYLPQSMFHSYYLLKRQLILMILNWSDFMYLFHVPCLKPNKAGLFEDNFSRIIAILNFHFIRNRGLLYICCVTRPDGEGAKCEPIATLGSKSHNGFDKNEFIKNSGGATRK